MYISISICVKVYGGRSMSNCFISWENLRDKHAEKVKFGLYVVE